MLKIIVNVYQVIENNTPGLLRLKEGLKMWIRIELHNHTIESDGTMTPTELSEFMAAQETPFVFPD